MLTKVIPLSTQLTLQEYLAQWRIKTDLLAAFAELGVEEPDDMSEIEPSEIEDIITSNGLKKVEARKAKELVDNKKKEENETKRQKQAEINATRREEQRMERKKRDDVAMALRLQKNFEKQKKTSAYQSMFNQRQSLPAFTRQAEVVDMIEKNQVVVISGATGCGKSTQVPQFVLDAMLESGRGAEASIVCTQPRRLVKF